MKSDTGQKLDYSFFGRPCLGEVVSGDTAVIRGSQGVLFLAIIDVLGHGQEAYVLAERIDEFLQENWSRDVMATLLRLHEEISGTRGAAVGICSLEVAAGKLNYVGVGNTVFRKFGSLPGHLHSTNGTIGAQIRTPVEHHLHLASSDIVLLHTDGVKNRFEMEDYPQMSYQSAQTVARSVVSKFGKRVDDATCIALRYKP